MQTSFRLFSFLFLLLTALPSMAGAPRPYVAMYKVKVDGISMGEMRRELQRDSAYQVLKTEMYTTGFAALFKDDRFTEQSRWQYRDGQLPLPLEYTYLHTNGSNRTFEKLSFDWSTNSVDSLRDGKVTPVAIEPGTMDKLAYQIALRRDVAAGKDVINYEVADRGDIRTYRFLVRGEERINTPLGYFDAIKIERISHDTQRKTFLWLAPKLDYILIQLVQDDGGHTYASYLQSLKYSD